MKSLKALLIFVDVLITFIFFPLFKQHGYEVVHDWISVLQCSEPFSSSEQVDIFPTTNVFSFISTLPPVCLWHKMLCLTRCLSVSVSAFCLSVSLFLSHNIFPFPFFLFYFFLFVIVVCTILLVYLYDGISNLILTDTNKNEQFNKFPNLVYEENCLILLQTLDFIDTLTC